MSSPMSNNNLASIDRGQHPVAGPTATALQKYVAGPDRRMISMSDDNVMMKHIMETHAPDGLELDIKPLLFLVEDILNRATMTSETSSTKMENNGEKVYHSDLMLTIDGLSHTIDRVSCELESKALSKVDAHATTLSILKMLSTFSWDAKLVLALAAFAFNYGEFWLLAQMYSSNQLAKSMAILKQLPSIMDHLGPGPLKARFDALNRLIRAMIEVTQCVVKLNDFPPNYISSDFSALSAAVAHVPTAAYWTIRSAIACASQIASLTNMGHEHASVTSEAWELSSLEQRLKNIAEHMEEQINLCYKHIDEKRSVEAYQKLIHLFEAIHIDNIKILKALICPKENVHPLVDGSTKTRVDIEVLRRKHVLLLISGLDISKEELSMLEQIHNESKQHSTRHEIPYEVVWIPIVDATVTDTSDLIEKRFESIQATMPWFSVYHPSLIDKVAVRFFKEVWHFKNKPILVVLDPQGKVVSPNAIHMMWIWGSNAFPFTTHQEETLWREESWRLELLVDGIDQNILTWGREGKYIFLYGGGDMEWMRRFTASARQVASAARIPLEMVYVGKRGKREAVRKAMESVTRENLSYCLNDLTLVWFFWTRLESMLFSKIQLQKDDDHDHVMQGIKKLLSYDKVGSWAILVHGSTVVVQGHSSTVLPTLIEYDLWKQHVPTKGYDVAFKDYHDNLQTSLAQPCCRFEFPTVGRVPNQLKCPECHGLMEKLITFLCCHDNSTHIPTIYQD